MPLDRYWKEHRFLTDLINILPHCVFWKDMNSVFLGCNQQFATAAGLKSPSQIVGKTDYDLPWEKYQSDIYRADDQAVMQTKIPKINIEEPLTLSNGEKIVLLTSKVPLLNRKRESIGVLAMYIDITHLKNKEEEIYKAKKIAEEANLLKTQFIQNMEHDIRTPFTGVWSMASLLAEKEADLEKKGYLNDIASCAKELLDYCNSILSLSRVENGAMPLLQKPFRLRTLIEKIILMETPAAKMKNLSLMINIDDTVPNSLIGDSPRLKKVLINLISNAIKFTNKGHIKIIVQVAKKEAEHRKVVLKITVKDTGIGISEDKQNMIYERFSKITPSNKGLYKGFGLGLPMVKRFLEDMDGDIHVLSEIGKGSVFTLFLPFKHTLVEDESLGLLHELEE
jgi:two-component system aerobic respiration control sensor histidine kinase ArcB